MKSRRARISLLIVLAVGLSVTAASPATSSGSQAPSKVGAKIWSETADGRSASFLVLLKSQSDVSSASVLRTKEQKGLYVYQTLVEYAQRTQAPIVSELQRMGASYRSHFLVNMLWVHGDRAVVDALAARPDVARIDAVVWFRPNLTVGRAAAAPKGTQTIEWNVTKVRAPQVWAKGYTGQGIVLGNIDTGQQWDHPALKEHYRGWNGNTADHNYNWYDATNPSNRAPLDPFGHGTHTAGTMVGDDGGTNQIGVAPGAKWFSCRSMDASGAGTIDTYTTCFEFMLAPWNLDHKNPDPSLAPVAVSNSWYCSISLEGCTQDALYQIVKNVRLAGIVPIVSAGNSGSACSTIGIDGPPAQYNQSYTVGASTQSDTLASFSSRGPVTYKGHVLIKPDITAPGVNVRSSVPTNGYAVFSGTSMASPHIAGVIALIYSARPNLIGDVKATEHLLNHTATQHDTSDCSSDGSHPNNLWGWGVVNAIKAFRASRG
jgi:serine protease AprX